MSVLFVFPFDLKLFFRQQNSHPAELTNPPHSLGFFYWENTFVLFAEFAVRLLV
jgi:hypothetical protein